MTRIQYPGRIMSSGSAPFTNYRFDDKRIGTRNTPISETFVPPPGGYTAQVMMVM
jgi:hypothetical protein